MVPAKMPHVTILVNLIRVRIYEITYLAFSLSRTLSLRASGTSNPPYLLRQRKKVCSVRLYRWHSSRICTPVVSASRRIRMICSSANRFFICKSPSKSYHRTHSLIGHTFRTQVIAPIDFHSYRS